MPATDPADPLPACKPIDRAVLLTVPLPRGAVLTPAQAEALADQLRASAAVARAYREVNVFNTRRGKKR